MSGLDPDRLARLAPVLESHIRAGLPGVVALIARGHQVHLDVRGARDLASGAPMTRDTLFRIASLTKPIAGATAMSLVEEGVLRLDEPVDRYLPELADRKVLRSLDAGLGDVVPAKRPITLRDLLTFRSGIGAIMAPPGSYPIQAAVAEAGVGPGPWKRPFPGDEWLRRLAALPLLSQPGDQWAYDTAADVLGVLLTRASGRSLGTLIRERILSPLRMGDTGFLAPDGALDRLGAGYARDGAGSPQVWDEAGAPHWGEPPAFESAAGGGGLLSTADDLLAFGRMMLAGGRGPDGERVLSRPAVELMTTDQITPSQKAASPFFPGFWDSTGWGFCVGVTTRRHNLGPYPGAFGWTGGTGTSWMCDPGADLVVITLTQRLMGAADDTAVFEDVQTIAYGALDD